MRTFWISIALLSTLLAGCADGSSAPPASDDDDAFDDLDGEATSTTGLIRGVVFDDTITPIEGVTVQIKAAQRETTTNAEGAFLIDDLEPGVHFLDVRKVGYTPVQQSVDVVAGVQKPDIVKVRLMKDLAALPSAPTLQFEGFLQCGVGLGAIGASTNPCFLTGSINTFDTPVEGRVNFTQIEMIWTGTNVFGDGLSIGINRPGTISDFTGTDGPSPRILRVEQATMEGALGQDYESYLIRVFPGTNQPVSAVVEQEFTIFATNFYGIVPEETWTFIEQGEYPVPT